MLLPCHDRDMPVGGKSEGRRDVLVGGKNEGRSSSDVCFDGAAHQNVCRTLRITAARWR